MLKRAVAATAALCFGAGGCGVVNQTSLDNATSDPRSTSVAAVDARIDALDQAVNGTLAQRRAASAAIFEDYQKDVGACMSSRRQTYTPAPHLDFYAGVDVLPQPPGGLAAGPTTLKDGYRTDLRRSVRLLRLGATLRALSMSVRQPAGYDEALSACLAQVPVREIPVPGPVQDASTTLAETLAAVGDRLPDAETHYLACLAGRGFVVASRDELVSQVYAAFAPFEVQTGPAIGASREWTAAVQLEEAAITADAQCRTDLHTGFVGSLGDTLDRLESELWPRSAEIRSFWHAVESRAISTDSGAAQG